MSTLLDPVPVVRIGRAKTLHRFRVLIEEQPPRVVVRTRCGIRWSDEFTETFGFPTCEDCGEDT